MHRAWQAFGRKLADLSRDAIAGLIETRSAAFQSVSFLFMSWEEFRRKAI